MALTIIRYVFYALAALAALAALVFIIRALVARSASLKKVYGVAKQNERQRMMLYAYYSIGWLVLGLIFVGIGSLTLLRGGSDVVTESAPSPTASPMIEQVEAILTETAVPTATATEVAPLEEPTATPVVESTISADQPTASDPPPTTESDAEPTPQSPEEEIVTVATGNAAIVNSPIVGLYLRVVPSGEILERLEDQVVITLLGEQQIIDGVEWIKVAAESGNEGWVASEFLDFEALSP